MDQPSVGVVICRSDELLECGKGICFSIHDGTHFYPAFAVRFAKKVSAFINRCGHMALTLDIQPAAFFDTDRRYIMCANHAALYDPMTGNCIAGPCDGRGLIALETREQSGQVILVDDRYTLAERAT